MDPNLKARLIRVCRDIGSPLSTHVESLIRADKEEELARLSVNPNDYDTSTSYKADAALCALFSSNESLDTSIDRKFVALGKWWDSEHLCCVTNARFANYLSGFYGQDDWRLVEFLDRVRKRIASILGPLPTHGFRGVMGPGSTYETAGSSCAKSLTAVDKIEAASATKAVIELTSYRIFQDRYLTPHIFGCGGSVALVRGSRWTSVPKNALSERSIAMEPGLNIYLQLGVESVLWTRLNRHGLDKATAQHHHRILARDALKLGLATLDLSMASDLWAANAVRFLLSLSPGWLGLFESLRCSMMEVEGKWVRLEKFSSMGNGFTFPLMTMMFYALVRELCGDEATVSVFGDDIICPADKAELVMSVLRFFGHKPNYTKSFWKGRFRESCGEDFFDGLPVRPHKLESWPTEVPDWYRLSNGLLHRDSHYAFRALAAWAIRQIPVNKRFYGPTQLGDSVLHSPAGRPRVVTRFWISRIKGIKDVSRSVHVDHFSGEAVLTAALLAGRPVFQYRRTPRKDSRVAYIPTRGVSGWKESWFTI